jgi:hypothetical protein
MDSALLRGMKVSAPFRCFRKRLISSRQVTRRRHIMKATAERTPALRETLEERHNKADVAHILEEDEIKQIYRDRSAEDALDEAEDNEAAEAEDDDELEEEDEVVQAAEANRK